MQIHELQNSTSVFASDDFLMVSGPTNQTRKMSKDAVLEQTATNTLKNNIAPEFDSTVAYTKGQFVTYQGKIYQFTSDHSAGAWNASHATVSGQNALLKMTAQNALENNLVPAFVPNETNAKANNVYVYEGVVYFAKEDYSGPWNSSKFTSINLSDYLLDYLGWQLSALTEGDRVNDCYIDANGAISYNTNYYISRFSVTPGSLIKVVTDGRLVYSTTSSSSNVFGPYYPSGVYLVPDGATYVFVSAHKTNELEAYSFNRPVNTEVENIYDKIGYDFMPMQKSVSSTLGFKVNANGTVSNENGYHIDRYAVTPGDLIKVVTDGRFIFSSTLSVSGSVAGPGLPAGVYRVPASSAFIIVSSSNDKETACGVATLPQTVTEMDQLVGFGFTSIPLYSETPNYKIEENGSVTYNTDYTIKRFEVTPGTIVKVVTSGVFILSITASVAGVVGEPIQEGCYVVPDGISYVLVSAAKSSVIMCGTKNMPYKDLQYSHWVGKKWYAYGTSITAPLNGRYLKPLMFMSGLDAVNKGIGGGGIGDLGAYSHGQVFDAICNTDDGKTEADLITLETGANDVNADVPLGTIYDTTRATLAGCLNICIRYLQANTNAQIAVMPSVVTTTEPNETNQYYKWQMMIRDICFINRVYFIDPACNLGFAKITGPDGTAYTKDNIHQTELGGKILAEAMWRQIKTIPLFIAPELPVESNES